MFEADLRAGPIYDFDLRKSVLGGLSESVPGSYTSEADTVVASINIVGSTLVDWLQRLLREVPFLQAAQLRVGRDSSRAADCQINALEVPRLLTYGARALYRVVTTKALLMRSQELLATNSTLKMSFESGVEGSMDAMMQALSRGYTLSPASGGVWAGGAQSIGGSGDVRCAAGQTQQCCGDRICDEPDETSSNCPGDCAASAQSDWIRESHGEPLNSECVQDCLPGASQLDEL
jgi:hypothetical protein